MDKIDFAAILDWFVAFLADFDAEASAIIAKIVELVKGFLPEAE